MANNAQDKWTEAARALPAPLRKLTVPIHVLTSEAVDLVRFAQRYWDPVIGDTGDQTLPGLKQAACNGAFSASTPQEMLELVDAVQDAQTEYRLLVKQRDPAPIEQARLLLVQLRSTLEWAFDDGQITDDDAQLAALADAHQEAYSYDAVAASLFDYAELAERHLDRIEGLGGFHRETVAEARSVARRLREPGPARQPPQPKVRTALDLRNHLVTLLYSRMLRTRAAARFVFRRHPPLVRQIGSTYERRKRAAARQRRLEATSGSASPSLCSSSA